MNSKLLEKLNSYKPPKSATTLIGNTEVVFFVGVTGAGKDTIMKRLLKCPDYHLIVSHTTRSPRVNHGILETNGVDYHFIDFETAENMLDNGGYIEAKVFSNNIYGTSLAEIQMAHDEGKIALADIEVQGVAEYYAISKNITPIFIIPPDFDTWHERLNKRHHGNQIDSDEMILRMKTAETELQEALTKTYFEYVINDDLEDAIKIADSIAHGHKSKSKNHEAKIIAEKLLKDLQEYLKQI